MFCGSCLHDNTLAAALLREGVDVRLVPTYTPIRTDEEDVSTEEVFFGGINVYLQATLPFYRFLPRILHDWLDRPALLRRVGAWGLRTSAGQLGRLTVSMLRGEDGPQKPELERLVRWLEEKVRPDLLNLTNILIGGGIPFLRRRLGIPILVTLQGDDLFIEGLTEPYRSAVLERIRALVSEVDGFIVFSQFYADFWADYAGIPADRLHIVPLGIRLDGFPREAPSAPVDRPPTVGYFARHCPAKGFGQLVDAFRILRSLPGTADARLRTGGWLGADDRAFFEAERRKLARGGLASAFEYAGVLDRREKIAFFGDVDVVSVPTIYREPKGLFVLESLACGVPVVQPDHGAFPEILRATGGGLLVPPGDPEALARALHRLLLDRATRRDLGQRGHAVVHRDFDAAAMARRTLAVYERCVRART
jgi:glycosyltransferase involved in cell wall biosynthesis